MVTLRSENGRSGWGKQKEIFYAFMLYSFKDWMFTIKMYTFYKAKFTYKVIKVEMYEEWIIIPISTYIIK